MLVFLSDGSTLSADVHSVRGPCTDVAAAADALCAADTTRDAFVLYPRILRDQGPRAGVIRLAPGRITGFRAQSEREIGRCSGSEPLEVWLRAPAGEQPSAAALDSASGAEVVGLGDRDHGRRGDWGQTVSGRRFYPLDPRPEDISIEDIAHALSHICRFGGHTCGFYSVAQHSLHVVALVHDGFSDRVMQPACVRETLLWALFHDAPEAYIGDMIRPLKIQPVMQPFRDADAAIMQAVCRRFDMIGDLPPEVKAADDIAVVTEARDLMWNPQWGRNKAAKPDRRRLTSCTDFDKILAAFTAFYETIRDGGDLVPMLEVLWPERVE